VNNSTFYNNIANGGNGATGGFAGGNGGDGGGTIFNLGTATVTATTVRGNFGIGGARGLGNSPPNHGFPGNGSGGLTQESGMFIVRSTISAGNTGAQGADVRGNFVSAGFNLIGTTNFGAGFAVATDQVGSDTSLLNPLLGPMQDNGGPTDTMALLNGSPALDRGHSFGLAAEQRGEPRLIDAVFPNAAGGDGADVGAFEVNFLGGPDSDGDEMSNDFEAYFGITDPNGNPDQDDLTNAQEAKAGTNPFDSASGLRITAVAVAGDALTVTFGAAVRGRLYRLERKDLISGPSWGSIAGVVDLAPTLTGPAQIVDPAGGGDPTHVYRIRVLP
jgi:hypothetical protein